MDFVRRLGRLVAAGALFLVAGIVCLTIGILELPPDVEGTFFNDPGDAAVVGVFAGPIEGRAWLIAGTVLAGLGGALALIAAARR